MEIGILGPPAGISEGRVLVTPRQAGVLDAAGVRVTIEPGAGARAGFEDADYAAEGAEIAPRQDVIEQSEILLAVARPTAAEAEQLREGAVVMSFYHLDVAGQELVTAARARGGVVIGLERVVDAAGRFPFRDRMAEIAGIVCAQLAARLMLSARGVLLGGMTGVPPADVVVIGAGSLGRAATRAFSGTGASVLLLDRDLGPLEMIERERLLRVQTMLAGPAEVADAAAWADVLVGAVRVPDGPPPKLLSPFQGKPGAVWLDLSVDEGGCFEDSRPVYSADQAYNVEGVICCPVPNLASWAGRTASRAGSALLAPILLRAAERGRLDLDREPELRSGAIP